MADSLDEEIRNQLTLLISKRSKAFRSASDFERAVSLIRTRYEAVSAMMARLNVSSSSKSYEAMAAQAASRSREKGVVNQSVNSIPLTSLVAPLSNRQSPSNGLCALPNRLDTLTGTKTIFPEHQCESNLTSSQVEPIQVSHWQKRPVEESFANGATLKHFKVRV